MESTLSRPSQEAIDKLRVIPVFVIAKSPTELYLSEQDGVTVIPLYLSKQSADEALSAYSKAIPGFDASIVFFTLDKMYPLIESFQAEYAKNSKQIVFPIVVRQENTDKAYEILRNDGFSDDQIRENLAMPMFYTDPVITIDSTDGSGPKKILFVDYLALQEAIDNLPSGTEAPRVKVANLDEVVDMISSSNSSEFEIYPTPEFLSLKKIHEAQLELSGISF